MSNTKILLLIALTLSASAATAAPKANTTKREATAQMNAKAGSCIHNVGTPQNQPSRHSRKVAVHNYLNGGQSEKRSGTKAKVAY